MRTIEKSIKVCIQMYNDMEKGITIALATKNPEGFKELFYEITNEYLVLEKVSEDIYSVSKSKKQIKN